MALRRFISLTKKLEDPAHPLLGPNIKGLRLFGLWPFGTRRAVIYNTFHMSTAVFVFSQFIELYLLRHDLHKALSNFSLTALSVICCFKCFSFVINQSNWEELAKKISQEELLEISKENKKTLKLLKKYKEYARMVTYGFWILVAITTSALLITPLMRILSSSSYRDDIEQGIEPLPQIFSSWFPFNNFKMPGYAFASAIQVAMAIQGGGVLAAFDTNAVAIMSFLKGQLGILKLKCTEIFEAGPNVQNYVAKIAECHRHHNFLEE
jgi:hypothetical protein